MYERSLAGDRMTILPTLFKTPPGMRLGPLVAIPDGQARPFRLDVGNGRFRGFVVREGDRVYGYVDRCPHNGMPLAGDYDDYLTPPGDLINCNWHGALFRISSGACIGGPCAGDSLTPWPLCIIDGDIITA